VHNILHCRQKKAEPRLQVTHTENLLKFGYVVWDMRANTQRHTETHIAILSTTRAKYWQELIIKTTTSTNHIRHRERKSFIFHNTAKHKRNNITITTAAWRVARKANQPIRAGNPCTGIENYHSTPETPMARHQLRFWTQLRCCWIRRSTSPRCRNVENSTKQVVLDFGQLAFHVKTWRHPEDREYITYYIAVRGRPIHGNR